jgi:hypothetical protein
MYPKWLKRESYRGYICTLCDWKGSHTEVISLPHVTEKGAKVKLYLYPTKLKKEPSRSYISTLWDWKMSHTEVIYSYLPYVTDTRAIHKLHLYPLWQKGAIQKLYLYPIRPRKEPHRSYICTLCDYKRSYTHRSHISTHKLCNCHSSTPRCWKVKYPEAYKWWYLYHMLLNKKP